MRGSTRLSDEVAASPARAVHGSPPGGGKICRRSFRLERARQCDASVPEIDTLRAARRTLGNAVLLRERALAFAYRSDAVGQRTRANWTSNTPWSAGSQRGRHRSRPGNCRSGHRPDSSARVGPIGLEPVLRSEADGFRNAVHRLDTAVGGGFGRGIHACPPRGACGSRVSAARGVGAEMIVSGDSALHARIFVSQGEFATRPSNR